MRSDRKRRLACGGLLCGGLGISAPAAAHGFGALYNLPVPLWLYGWAAAATLLLSFLAAAAFLSLRREPVAKASRDISASALAHGLRAVLPVLRMCGVFLLGLCIATGFFGSRDPLRNFAPVFFWVVFLLGFSYLVALIGDGWAAINPFRSLARWLGRIVPGFTQGRLRYPQRWGDWPALALYLAFIGFELFGSGKPRPVAGFLSAYLALNVLGVGAFGARAWFAHCEFFSVLFRLLGTMAPLDYRPAGAVGASQLRLRAPFAGLLHRRPVHLSTVVFVFAMLSTTAFDGLRATQWWVNLFWDDPTGWLAQYAGARPVQAIGVLRPWYLAWEWLWLVALPFVYFGAYLLAIVLARWLAGGGRSLRELALDFAYPLLPIALVYNITHYWTLLLAHGAKILSVASDPFGWRWDLFGTAMKFRAPILPDMGFVWHSQVGLILFGHVIGIWVAHRVAQRLWPSRRRALLSQLPMLVLMIAFTIAGLWILAQPLTEMKMR